MPDRQLARVLKRLRNERGLSQEDLAAAAHLHRTYVSQLERGLKSPSLRSLRKIADALSVSMTDIVSLIEREPTRASSTR